MRLIEAQTIRDANAAEPLMLLDDPFAELDVHRAGRILDLLEDRASSQTMLAVPREAEVPSRYTRLERFRVVNGVIAPASA